MHVLLYTYIRCNTHMNSRGGVEAVWGCDGVGDQQARQRQTTMVESFKDKLTLHVLKNSIFI